MNKLSVVISAWNEKAKIERTLSSVAWADEIIFVDSDSTDKTVAIAKNFTKKIFHRSNNPMLNVNKNFGFTKATGDWILSLDADEVISPELAKEIDIVIRNPKSEIRNPNITGYWIPRKNIIFGKWIQHGLWWPDNQLRLFRRGRGKFPEKHVHEYLVVDGPTDTLIASMIHYNYETVSQYLRKLDAIYTESEVANLLATDYQLAWYDAIRFPVSDFLKVYFAQEGYKDGLHGLVLSLLQSFYSLVVFAKLWEKKGFRQESVSATDFDSEIKKASKELTYWTTTKKIQETGNPLRRLWLRTLRKYVTR
ncbi:glycosyltransferase family 2 protein [Candidatus Gottesmanbacteria bacterium]|nr:glycosyltransferase family 2 protein [Candidatus Gottesmanbacteria bacterium]